jgi:hypothetical protein
MFKSLTLPSKTLLLGVATVVLAANPTTYDPFNVTRFLILTILASVLLFTSVTTNIKEFFKEFKVIVVISLLFCIQLFLVLFFSQANKDQQIFGVFGRSLGFVSYLSLVIVFLSTIKLSTKLFLNYLFKVITISGGICLFYSFLQSINLDPIPWTNPYSPIIGVFGNPNFNSAFLGMTAGSLLVTLLFKKTNNRLMSLTYIFTSLVLIYLSKSIQGFLVFGFIATILIIILAFKLASLRKYRYVISISSLSLILLAILDMLQKVPWNSFLYKGSLTQRGDLWRGAWEMGTNFPIFGVGLDSYIDFHYRSRDAVAARHGWVNELTNDAHSVPLNLLATGGFPLFILYILILIYTGTRALAVLKRMQGIDHKFVAIFLLWVGYLAQSLISINHLSLAILGWVLSGSIIGYEKYSRNESDQKNLGNERKTTSSINYVKILVGLIIGILVGIGPVLNDRKMYNALSTGQIVLLKEVVEYRPKSVHYLNIIAEIFEKNKLDKESLEIAKFCIESFPNSGFAWSVIYRSQLVTQDERDLAKKKILEINPYAKF